MRAKLLLIPVLFIILLNLPSFVRSDSSIPIVKSECSKDGKSISLVFNDKEKILNWERCYDGSCIIYKHKAYCTHKEEVKQSCVKGFSIHSKKTKQGWIRLIKKCKGGCNGNSCLTCCKKRIFKFGRNCYESSEQKGCGFFTKSIQDSCANVKSCIASGKPQNIKLGLNGNKVTIPKEKIGNAEKVVFNFNDGKKEKSMTAKLENDYYFVDSSDLAPNKYDVEIYVLYKGKDYRMKYISSVNLIYSMKVCINCNSSLLPKSTFHRCSLFFNSIQQELLGTGIDPWLIIGLIAQESSCRYEVDGGAFQVDSYLGHSDYNPPRNNECEKYVDSTKIPNDCKDFVNKIKFQVHTGVQHFLNDYNRINVEDPIVKFAVVALSYNRGWSTVNPTLNYYAQGYDLYSSLKKGCKDIYNGKRERAYDNSGNDMCTYVNGYGACYPTAIIKKLKKIAEDCNGYLNQKWMMLRFKECS